jgi:hypothetical protein
MVSEGIGMIERERERENAQEQIGSAATCSRWFFYPEDGGDTFLRNVG